MYGLPARRPRGIVKRRRPATSTRTPGADMRDDQTAEVQSTELLRTLIKNACVNDGTPESGHESRSVDALEDFFAGSGLAVERRQSMPGRRSLIARIEG